MRLFTNLALAPWAYPQDSSLFLFACLVILGVCLQPTALRPLHVPPHVTVSLNDSSLVSRKRCFRAFIGWTHPFLLNAFLDRSGSIHHPIQQVLPFLYHTPSGGSPAGCVKNNDAGNLSSRYVVQPVVLRGVYLTFRPEAQRRKRNTAGTDLHWRRIWTLLFFARDCGLASRFSSVWALHITSQSIPLRFSTQLLFRGDTLILPLPSRGLHYPN
jgi:hypothetical protein